MGILKALSNCKHNAPLAIRKLANLAYYNPEVHCLHPSVKVITVDNCSFYVTDGIESVQAIKDNPIFRNIRPTDVCLDIGACIGAFTVPLAKMTKKVYAVEPLYYEYLRENLYLNDIRNCTAYWLAIGEGGIATIQYGGKRNKAHLISYKNLASVYCEKVDFLKLDCEGAEWTIPLEELEEVREIRAELHIRRGHEHSDYSQFHYWEAWLKKHNYTGTCEQTLKNTDFDPNFRECFYVNYSKLDNFEI